MSNYLDGQTGLYGLPATLPAGVAEQASSIVDNHLNRPEGLIYVSDKNGNPAFMRALTPSFSYAVPGGIPAGQNVTVTVTPPNVRIDLIGEVLVLDQNNPDLLEAVVVAGVQGNNQLTLQNVQFTHGANAKMDMGMVLAEERSVPAKRSVVRYSKYPCVAILSLMGRYGFGRRSDQMGGLYQELNLLSAVQTFGGPPQWIPIALAQTSWSDATGEIWVPAGTLLAYYSEVKMRYVAGFPTPPDPIVRATSSIAQGLISSNNFGGGNVKSISAGDSRIQKFGPTYIDEDTRMLLKDFKARSFY